MSQLWPSRLAVSSLLLAISLSPSCGHLGIGGGGDVAKLLPPMDMYSTCAVADFNGDGKLDFAVSYAHVADVPPHPGFVAVYLQDPAHPGAFLTPSKYGVPNDPTVVVAADLNGDGRPDLAVVNTIASVDTTGSSSVSVLLQDAANPGKFLPATNYLTGFAPVAVAADDLNQDGRIDLVVSNAVGFTILLQSSTAPGQFVAEPSVTVAGGGTAGIAIADVNGDGRNDIIATATDVMVYLQDPVAAGSFLAPMHYMAGAQPYSILTEDLNGDGRPDLAVANLGSADGTVKANMSVLLQNPAGRGTFLPATNYATGVRAWTIAAGDLNGDGKQDLVVGNMGSFDGSSISVFMQNPASPGSFQPAVNYADTSNVGWVAIADMNGDGKPDLLIVDAGVSVRFQDSAHPGTFLAPTVIVSP